MMPEWLSEFEGKVKDLLEPATKRLRGKYPDVSFSINSNYWGQSTNADGYIIYLSCLWSENCEKRVDTIDLEISFSHVNTKPSFIADVCWGSPSGLIENEFSPDKLEFNECMESELILFLPNLIESLDAALERGEPWE